MSFRILFIPVDGSENSKQACEQAVRLAESGREKAILAHCFDAIPQRIHGPALEELEGELAKEAKQIFAECRHFFDHANIPVETLVLFGSQGETLAEAAVEHNSDIIIMGSSGLGNLGNLVMGSVSNDVIHSTKLPVLIAPKRKDED